MLYQDVRRILLARAWPAEASQATPRETGAAPPAGLRTRDGDGCAPMADD